MSNLIEYSGAYFRKDNKGNIQVWFGRVVGQWYIDICYGILGKTITNEHIKTYPQKPDANLKSRINTKRKAGYMMLSEVSDSAISPVEELDIIRYLTTYLPEDRQSSTGAMLPQLAKLYDNTNNKLYKDDKWYIGQPKINGLRGLIGAVPNNGDLFKPIKLTFQSREGTYWDSLSILEEELLKLIPVDLLKLMVEENYLLDGEMYIPNKKVNDMNSIVKNTKNEDNKNIQFWCYDIAIPNMSQFKRTELLRANLNRFSCLIEGKDNHYKVASKLMFLPEYVINNHEDAVYWRNTFIAWDFEGLILRDPDSEYQFGKRNSAMWKFKSVTDGKFQIIDIQPEGNKREGIPLLTLRNDINSEVFKVHVNGSFEYQKYILDNFQDYISKYCFVEYGERSGVNQLPFHVKTVTIINE